jgi:hypothetical protein
MIYPYMCVVQLFLFFIYSFAQLALDSRTLFFNLQPFNSRTWLHVAVCFQER